MSTSSNWMTRKRIGALLLFALSLFYGWQIQDIPQLPVDELEAMNARSMPWALAALGIVLSVALFASGGGTRTENNAATRYQRENVIAAIVLLVWTAFYATLLGWLGFFAATAGFLLGGFYLLGERRPVILANVALSAALLLYVLLRFGLGLYLPGGSLWLVFGATNV